MRKLIVAEFVSLDGVMQAPGGAEEDTEGGFTQGGWTQAYWHDDIGMHFFASITQADALLLGRKTWQIHGGAVLQTMLPACAIEVLLPNAYFNAWRESDLSGRGWGVRSTVDYLQAILALPAASLRVVIAPFYDHVLEEYRVGFTRVGSNDVLHGVVWPLIGNEDEATEVANEIETIVRDAGISEVLLLNERMPLEYCDDCGAPLFPNPEGELVHAQIPESAELTPHLH